MQAFVKAAVLAAIATIGSGTAFAGPNLVTNGSFEANTCGGSNTEFGASWAAGPGQCVTGWSSNGTQALNILYFGTGNTTTATTVVAADRFSTPGHPDNSKLWAGTASPDGGNFVALDGDTNYDGPLTQTINGLTVGDHYALTFDFGAGQFQNRTGATTEKLQVSLGSQTQTTPTLNNASQSFTGWTSQTLTFTATSASELLSFLSIGTPNGLPPIATLDGVSLTDVPEPATLAVLGTGLAVGIAAFRRRKV